MDAVTLVRKVQDAIETRMYVDRKRTEEIIGAVFSALSVRLTGKEGENLISQLPAPLKELWYEKAFVRSIDPSLWNEEAVIKLSKEEFVALIKKEGKLATMEEAEFAGRCVIHFLKEAISPGEVHDATCQLPSDLKGWVEAA